VPRELPDELKPVIQRLVEDFGFDITEAMSFAHKFDSQRIVENLDITEKRVRANQEKGIETDTTKYARKAIETDFRQKKTGLELRLESEKKKKKSENSTEAIRNFLDTYYHGWYQAKLDEYIANAGDNFKDAFQDYLESNDDLLMHTVREAFKEKGFDAPLVKNQLRIFYSEELGLQEKFNIEFFMDDNGYSIRPTDNGDELYKFGKKINL
ncbi:MAG: hypothetical protein NE330_09420, partial [Lentisphaeraceae bacterium]|nr:hypothetical protein [Lentisphaeraceae bacterium]